MLRHTPLKLIDWLKRLRPTNPVRAWDYFWASLFLVFWLVPMIYRGLTNDILFGSWMPNTVTHQQNISRLFTVSVPKWPTYHLQGTFDGQLWFTLPDEQYSPMKPFGHRSRLDRMIGDNNRERGTPNFDAFRDELLDWIERRFAKLHPESQPLRGVRVVQLIYESGGPIAQPRGHWIKSIPEHVKDQKPRVLYSRIFLDE